MNMLMTGVFLFTLTNSLQGLIDAVKGIGNTVSNAVSSAGNALSTVKKVLDPNEFVEVFIANMQQPIIPGWVSAQIDCDFAIDDGIVDTIGGALTPFAISMAAVFFFLALLELGMSERANPETVIKFFSKFAISVLLIYLTPQLVKLGSAVGSTMNGAILSGISDLGNAGSPEYESVRSALSTAMEGSTPWQRMILWMNLNMFQGLASGCTAVVLGVLITRHMEIVIRGACMPVAMAFVTTEGWQAGSIRYIKKYIALFIQGPIIALILGLSNTIYQSVAVSAFNANGISGMVSANNPGGAASLVAACGALSVGCMLGIIGAIRGSMNIANDVMGV